jgi:hypothetical protein
MKGYVLLYFLILRCLNKTGYGKDEHSIASGLPFTTNVVIFFKILNFCLLETHIETFTDKIV